MTFDKPIQRIAIVGTGVIGASWAAQYLARGFDVVATDPGPDAEANLRKYVDEAWAHLDAIGLSPGASRDRLSFTPHMKEALAKADFVQENAPERPEFKIKLFADMDARRPCGFDHRVELVGDHTERDAVELQAARASLDRASLQSSAHHSARGSRRGGQDGARSDPAGNGVLRVHRQEARSGCGKRFRAMSRIGFSSLSIRRSSISSNRAC